MMGAVGLLAQSVFKFPGFENVPSGLSAQWTEPGSNALWLLVAAIGCFDIGLSPWKEDPEDPGNFGDPLNLAKGNITDDIRSSGLLVRFLFGCSVSFCSALFQSPCWSVGCQAFGLAA
eukprot:Skav230120  [mRNA]  locus=scaffold2446:184142:184495:- [translate_table: standard]